MNRQEAADLSSLSFFASDGDPEALRAAGPAIGPMHSGIIPPPPDLRKNVPAGAVLSPLAITLRGLRKTPYAMKKVSQIVVHMTGQGPAGKSKKSGYKKPAIDFALDWYLGGGPNGGFPHYVIDFNGTIYATSDERNITYHAGWVHPGGAGLFRSASWRAPAWWLQVWQRFGFKSPLELLPVGANGPNSRSIGIELLITTGLAFTDAQYRALARLILDIERRHNLAIPSAPSPVLLGHEDYSPTGRSNQGGGWDPGAHRTKPYFSWSRVWSYMRGAGMPSTPTPAPTPTRQSTGPLANPSLRPSERKALLISSTFETGTPGSFHGLTGNSDGQGISFGLLNWNIGTGSLQPLLQAFATQHPARWNAVFGPDAQSFAALIAGRDRNVQLRFAVQQMNDATNHPRQPWVTYFQRLGNDTEFQNIQIRAVRPLLDRARAYCQRFGLTSERAFTFMFDAVTQQGPYWLTRKIGGVERRRILLDQRLTPGMPEADVLLTIADVIAETSLEKYRAAVRARKRWFVTGQHPNKATILAPYRPDPNVAY